MTRLTPMDAPRRYPLRCPGSTFDLVLDWAEDNKRSVNAELVALVEEALHARAAINEAVGKVRV